MTQASVAGDHKDSGIGEEQQKVVLLSGVPSVTSPPTAWSSTNESAAVNEKRALNATHKSQVETCTGSLIVLRSYLFAENFSPLPEL